MYVAIALILIIAPPVLYLLYNSFKNPFNIILLSFVAYTMIGYYKFFNLFSLFQIFVLFAVFVYFVRAAYEGKHEVSRDFMMRFFLPGALFLITLFMSIRVAMFMRYPIYYCRSYIGSFMYAFVVYQFTRTEHDVKNLMHVFAAVLALNAVAGIVQYIGGSEYYIADILTPSVNNVSADYMDVLGKPKGFYYMTFEYGKDLIFMAIPLMALLFMQAKSFMKTLLLSVLIMIATFAIVTCEVRSSQLGFIVGMLYIVYRTIQASKNKTLILSQLAVIVVVFAAALSSMIAARPTMIYRYQLIDHTMFLRLLLFYVGVLIIKANWLWGVGAGNFKYVYYEYLPPFFEKIPFFGSKAYQPHNVFIDLWSGAGIFSVILYLTFFITTFGVLEKVRRRKHPYLSIMAVGFQAYLIGFFIECFFHNHIFDNNFWLLIGLSYAMLGITAKMENSRAAA